MRLVKILVAFIILSGSVVSLCTAKMEYSKKEGKPCSYCHSGSPPSAKNLNDAGKYYKDHNHSLEGYKPAPKPTA
jgi:hypothetical protein